jgi:hypothetical protein
MPSITRFSVSGDKVSLTNPNQINRVSSFRHPVGSGQNASDESIIQPTLQRSIHRSGLYISPIGNEPSVAVSWISSQYAQLERQLRGQLAAKRREVYLAHQPFLKLVSSWVLQIPGIDSQPELPGWVKPCYAMVDHIYCQILLEYSVLTGVSFKLLLQSRFCLFALPSLSLLLIYGWVSYG